MAQMMETKQEVWENSFQENFFTGNAGIWFDQVFHQNPKLKCFYQLLKNAVQ